MKNVRSAFGGLLVVISMCILLVFVGTLAFPSFKLTVRDILMDLFGLSLFCVSGFYFIASGMEQRIEQERLMECAISMVFLAYIITLGMFIMTNSLLVKDQGNAVNYHWEKYIQMIPFHTMIWHVKLLKENEVTFRHEFFQIMEHLLKFTPFGFILPFVFRKCRNMWYMLYVATIFILFYGVLELAMRAGIQDVDYFILNMVGVFCAFQILNCKVMQKFLWKIYILHDVNYERNQIIKFLDTGKNNV